MERDLRLPLSVLFWSRQIALDHGANEIGVEHLLLALFREPFWPEEFSDFLPRTLGLPAETVAALVAKIESGIPHAHPIPNKHGDMMLTQDAVTVVSDARELAGMLGHSQVRPLHVAAVIHRCPGPARDTLSQTTTTEDAVRHALGI